MRSDPVHVSRFEIDDRSLQGAGVVQGGVLTGMLADAMTRVASDTVEPTDASPRLEALDIVFLRPAPVGAFVATTLILRHARTTMLLQAELADRDGRIVATARATCLLSRP